MSDNQHRIGARNSDPIVNVYREDRRRRREGRSHYSPHRHHNHRHRSRSLLGDDDLVNGSGDEGMLTAADTVAHQRKVSTFRRHVFVFLVVLNHDDRTISAVNQDSGEEKVTIIGCGDHHLQPYFGVKHLCENKSCPRPILTLFWYCYFVSYLIICLHSLFFYYLNLFYWYMLF